MKDILENNQDSILSEENNKKTKKIDKKDKKTNKKNKIITALSITTAALAMSTVGFGIAFGVVDGQSMQYQNELESVYHSNFYSLLDSVNNLENRLSKAVVASSSGYQRKTLLEASKNASEAEIAVASLPLNQSDIQDTIKLVNQIAGYTSTIADRLVKGDTLSQDEINTLSKVHATVLQLKQQLNDFERKLNEGYSIINSDFDVNTSNEFSRALSAVKDNNVEYPTMIYDGPFSDSVTMSEVKGLKGNEVSKAEAMQNVERNFKNATDVAYEGETKGLFETYNFRVKNTNEEMLFVQVTKVGGNILTISGAGTSGEAQIDFAGAKDIALKFVSDNGVENAEVVWSDTLKNDIYLNIAPKAQGLVLYPDLVKVKINLASGTIVGYDATSYFTNHVSRSLNSGKITIESAKNNVPSGFSIVSSRKVLSPLEYNREVVCVEVEATKEGNTYYFYYNAETGEVENILKVIKTDNGNLLM